MLMLLMQMMLKSNKGGVLPILSKPHSSSTSCISPVFKHIMLLMFHNFMMLVVMLMLMRMMSNKGGSPLS